MSFDVEILNFSKIYDQESFYHMDKSSHFIDLSDVPGTNCMCDDEAVSEIGKRTGSPCGVHFIDNGNYHYMSAVYLRKVKEPFSLVVLDHHPDMQRPMFDILSCGGWVLDVIENNEFVRDIHVIGADRKLIDELEDEVRDRARFYDVREVFGGDGSRLRLPESSFPMYLSVDKDVITRDELVTNWDQGEATAAQVLAFIEAAAHAPGGLLGVDICGECAPDQEGIDLALALSGNDDFNRKVLEILGRAKRDGIAYN